MRSISGLRSKAEILPLNPEFEVEPPEEYAGLEKQEGRRVIDQSIEIDISKGEAYTVVLRMRGGIDKKFFKVFNFG